MTYYGNLNLILYKEPKYLVCNTVKPALRGHLWDNEKVVA